MIVLVMGIDQVDPFVYSSNTPLKDFRLTGLVRKMFTPDAVASRRMLSDPNPVRAITVVGGIRSASSCSRILRVA